MRETRPRLALLPPVALSFALLGFGLGDVIWLSICLAVIVGSYLHGRTLELALDRRTALTAGAVWLLALIWYETALGGGEGLRSLVRVVPGSQQLLASGGLLCAALLAALWHRPRADEHTGSILALTGLIAIFSGDHYGLGGRYLAVLALYFTAVVVAAAVSGLPPRGPWRRQGQRSDELGLRGLASVALILVVGAATVGTGLTLRVVEGRLLSARFDVLGLGLPDYSGLGAGGGMRIRTQGRVRQSGRLVATVSGAVAPGLLRTQVMHEYNGRHWKASHEPGIALEPTLTSDGDRRFELGPASNPPESERAVTLMVDLSGAVPMPYGVTAVETGDEVGFVLAPGGVLDCSPSRALGSYRAIGRADGRIATVRSRALDAAGSIIAPESVLARLRPLALEVTADAVGSLAAATRIEAYFRHHYTYSPEVALATDDDPIVDFVLNRKPAYCEHYASGMALMLASLEIPARVAGGFSVEEWNDLAEAWSVRGTDAHAWTEVYDPAAGRWVPFDATPPWVTDPRSGAGGALPFLVKVRDWTRLLSRRVGDAWRRARLPQRAAAAALSLWTWGRARPGLGVGLAVSLAALLWWRWGTVRGLRGRRRRLPARPPRNAEVATAATHCFERLALVQERRGQAIGRGESASEYLARVGLEDERLAEFFRLYAAARFGGDTDRLPELGRVTDSIRVVATAWLTPVRQFRCRSALMAASGSIRCADRQ